MTTETSIIQTIRQFAPENALSDDAYYDPATRQIYTADLLVEGQHFLLDYFSPVDVGWKAAAVNISDIAAMGGTLKYLIVSIGLPEPCVNSAFIQQLYEGIQSCCLPFGGQIIGGDTVKSEQLTINITAVGALPNKHTLGQRNNAEPGDWVITSGESGLSGVGFQAFQNSSFGYDVSKSAHLKPQPQIDMGLELSQSLERFALMDTSDGLADAVLKIAAASNMAIELEAAGLPLHEELRQWSRQTGASPLDLMLYGGEDFQLLATVPPNTALSGDWHIIGEVLKREIGKDSPVWIKNGADETLPITAGKTYQHFD